MKIVLSTVILLFLIVVPIVTSHISAPQRTPASTTIYDYESEQDEVSLQKIKKILETQKINNIEDLLSYLNTAFPQFMERHTFVFDSRSLHGSSYKNPRAIVYGKSANFILTFNGSPDQEGFQKLEVAQFNQKKKTYDFIEIEFSSSKSPGYSISKPGGPGGICLQCHINNKPIWDTYDIWPGVYGSIDEEPLRASQKFLPNIPVSNSLYLDGEKNMWLEFLQIRLKHPRYKWLPIPLSKDNSLYDQQGKVFFPNTELSVKLTRNNFPRIMNDIKKNKHKFSKDIVSQVLFSFDCRRVDDESVKKAIEVLKVRYQESILAIENKLKSRMIDVLLRYSKAPYFNRNLLLNFLAFRQDVKNMQASEGFQITSDSNLNQIITKEISTVLLCLEKTYPNMDSSYPKEWKACFEKHKTPELDKINLTTFYQWLYKKNLASAKSRANRIAISAAIFESHQLGLSTDSWSTLQFGEQDYSTGSGIEESLFRNGFAQIFNRTEAFGGKNAFGEFVLKSGLEPQSAFLSEQEIKTYCKDLVTSTGL